VSISVDPLAHFGSDRPAQLLRKPQFDERLPCHTEAARLSVEGVDHPAGKSTFTRFASIPTRRALLKSS